MVLCRLSFGGSLMRPEATGYGLVYFVQNMLEDKGDSLKVCPSFTSFLGNILTALLAHRAAHAGHNLVAGGAICVQGMQSFGSALQVQDCTQSSGGHSRSCGFWCFAKAVDGHKRQMTLMHTTL